MPQYRRNQGSGGSRKTARQSQGDAEALRRQAAARETVAGRARAGAASDHESVASPPAAAPGGMAGRGGTEAASVPIKGESETPFHGWPAARAEYAGVRPA